MQTEYSSYHDVIELSRRKIVLDDGRYMIFYTWPDEHPATTANDTAKPLPGARPEAEEKDV